MNHHPHQQRAVGGDVAAAGVERQQCDETSRTTCDCDCDRATSEWNECSRSVDSSFRSVQLQYCTTLARALLLLLLLLPERYYLLLLLLPPLRLPLLLPLLLLLHVVTAARRSQSRAALASPAPPQ